MLKRPLLLKLIALYLVLDPIIRVIFLSIEKEFSFSTVLTRALALSPVELFNFWFLFPLSGILLLGVKTYSYVLFISIQIYSLFFHLNYESYSWPYLSKYPSMTAYLLLALNIFFVVYLLMPRSRELFFDKNLRWWERGSRYTINEPCFAQHLDTDIHGKVCDLSFGGALIELDEPLSKGSMIKLDFDLMNRSLSLNAQIVRIIQSENGETKYGVQFLFESYFQRLGLKLMMLTVSKLSAYEKYR